MCVCMCVCVVCVYSGVCVRSVCVCTVCVCVLSVCGEHGWLGGCSGCGAFECGG